MSEDNSSPSSSPQSRSEIRASLVDNYLQMEKYQKQAMIEMRDHLGGPEFTPFVNQLLEWQDSTIPGSPFESVLNSFLNVIAHSQQILENLTKDPSEAQQTPPPVDPELVKVAQEERNQN